jgi:hypothetical protein
VVLAAVVTVRLVVVPTEVGLAVDSSWEAAASGAVVVANLQAAARAAAT